MTVIVMSDFDLGCRFLELCNPYLQPVEWDGSVGWRVYEEERRKFTAGDLLDEKFVLEPGGGDDDTCEQFRVSRTEEPGEVSALAEPEDR